jgi:hypothetical protein
MLSWRAGLVPLVLVGSIVLAFFANRTVVELSWLAVIVVFVGISIAYADMRGRY